MKIKKIESILKARKTIVVFSGNGVQWLGDGAAFYPVYNLPKLTRDNLFTMFDIPEDKREKFYFEERGLPSSVNFEDFDDGETVLGKPLLALYAKGMSLEAYETSKGVSFINSRYREPFADIEDGIELYERTTPAGRTYFAVKGGFIVLGIISPVDILNEDFTHRLDKLAALAHKETEARATLDQIAQVSLDEEMEESA